jgi:hypothetical protein
MLGLTMVYKLINGFEPVVLANWLDIIKYSKKAAIKKRITRHIYDKKFITLDNTTLKPLFILQSPILII